VNRLSDDNKKSHLSNIIVPMSNDKIHRNAPMDTRYYRKLQTQRKIYIDIIFTIHETKLNIKGKRACFVAFKGNRNNPLCQNFSEEVLFDLFYFSADD